MTRRPSRLWATGGWLVEALQRGLHGFCYVLAWAGIALLFPLRSSGSRHLPRAGGVIILSNHQSFLDPVLLGLAIGRRACYLARSSLFRFAPFRWLIAGLDAIPIEREGLGKEGLKECLRRLEQGRVVVVWPEGTRTTDGRVGPLRPGVLVLLRRARVPVLLAGVSGAYASWPRHQLLPRRVPIWVHFEPWQVPEKIAGDHLSLLQADLEAAVIRADQCRLRSSKRLSCPGTGRAERPLRGSHR